MFFYTSDMFRQSHSNCLWQICLQLLLLCVRVFKNYYPTMSRYVFLKFAVRSACVGCQKQPIFLQFYHSSHFCTNKPPLELCILSIWPRASNCVGCQKRVAISCCQYPKLEQASAAKNFATILQKDELPHHLGLMHRAAPQIE